MKLELFKKKNKKPLFRDAEAETSVFKKGITFDWVVALYIFIVSLLLLIGVSTYLFLQVNSDSFSVTVENTDQNVGLDVNVLHALSEEQIEKRAKFESLQATSTSFIDPSVAR